MQYRRKSSPVLVISKAIFSFSREQYVLDTKFGTMKIDH